MPPFAHFCQFMLQMRGDSSQQMMPSCRDNSVLYLPSDNQHVQNLCHPCAKAKAALFRCI